MNTILQDGVSVCIPSAPKPYAAFFFTAANVLNFEQ
jgi:hypothetical protein